MNGKIKKEVISIPASGTTDLIYKYKCHAHPDKPLGYEYKPSLYYTFREKGGIMVRLFTLDFIVSLNPHNLINLNNYTIDAKKQKRLLSYIQERIDTYGFKDKEINYKFYIFKEDMQIELSHHPRKPNQRNHCYFTLNEILSEKEVSESFDGKRLTSYDSDIDEIGEIKLGTFGSWEILSNTVAIKTTDLSIFKHKGSSIHKETRLFWEMMDIKPGEKRNIKITYNNKIYGAYITMEKGNLRRTRMFWNSDLQEALYNGILNYHDYFNDEHINIEPPIMRFKKTNKENYKVSLIVQEAIEEDLALEEETESDFISSKEGSIKYFYSKKYERSQKNRLEAIKLHGTTCFVCGFNFEECYGHRGSGFIEIHHIHPLSHMDKEVTIDIKSDLVPVCSNCHRMIHRERNNVLSISEAKIIMNNSVDYQANKTR